MPTPAGYQVTGTWDLLGSGEYIAGGRSQAHHPRSGARDGRKPFPNLHSASFWFHLPPVQPSRARHRAPLFTFPRKVFPSVFYRFPLRGDENPHEACSIMGRQESAAGISSPGTAVTSQNLGYWIKGLPQWATAVSKSALIPRKLSLNKPGPGRDKNLEGAPSNYQVGTIAPERSIHTK
jgi:hypothetical protein